VEKSGRVSGVIVEYLSVEGNEIRARQYLQKRTCDGHNGKCLIHPLTNGADLKPHVEIAVAFASAFVNGDFARASAMLTPTLRPQLTPEMLRERFYAMFRGYASGEPKGIHYDEEFALTDWLGKMPNDVGSLYVSIEGEDFLEAVDLTVTDIDGVLLIRDIIWGRP
jgi:hypothetical protein